MIMLIHLLTVVCSFCWFVGAEPVSSFGSGWSLCWTLSEMIWRAPGLASSLKLISCLFTFRRWAPASSWWEAELYQCLWWFWVIACIVTQYIRYLSVLSDWSSLETGLKARSRSTAILASFSNLPAFLESVVSSDIVISWCSKQEGRGWMYRWSSWRP